MRNRKKTDSIYDYDYDLYIYDYMITLFSYKKAQNNYSKLPDP